MINNQEDQTLFYIEQPLTHITAYSKAGKTSLAVSFVCDALIHFGKRVLYVSPGKENSKEIRHRMVAAWKEYPLAQMDSILENPKDIRHEPAQNSLMATFQLPLLIRPEANPSFEEFRKWCLWHVHFDKIDLIIVDDFHLIKGSEQMKNLQELQRIASKLQISCIAFTSLPVASDQDLRRRCRLNVRLNACVDLGMWLDRPIYEIDAELEVIKSIGLAPHPEEKIKLCFNPRSGHYEDIETIGIHLNLADMNQECSF